MDHAARSGPDGITVFLVDDHELVRRGLVALLEQEGDLRVVGQAGTCSEAKARVPALRPDVAVLDIRLPDGSGVELCRDLRSTLPDLRCLMVTSYTDEEAVLDAVLAGAAGYVIKDIRGVDLVSAVRTVGSGGSLLDNRAAAVVMDRLRSGQEEQGPWAGLTDQERTLLELVAEGLTNRQIGERMFLAEKTVKNYVSRLLAKLGVQRRTQAARLVAQARESRRDQR